MVPDEAKAGAGGCALHTGPRQLVVLAIGSDPPAGWSCGLFTVWTNARRAHSTVVPLAQLTCAITAPWATSVFSATSRVMIPESCG